MDSLTHIALGAIIGEAVAGKQLGKKAMLIGAIAHSIPDIDFVLSFFLSPVNNLLAHRGFAHSILFDVLLSILLGLVMFQWGKLPGLSRTKWILFFALEITIHLLLDAFNNYGVGWFEPFSHFRLSFNTVFVADPFYSIWLGIGAIALLSLSSGSKARRFWIISTLVISSAYLCYALHNKNTIDNRIVAALSSQHIEYKRYFTTPAAFNNWLWYYTVEIDSGYYVGYSSVFDTQSPAILDFYRRNAEFLKIMKDDDDTNKLLRFSQGYYTVEARHDTLIFNDLRFGQVAGWSEPEPQFAFHYYLNYPKANLLVVQRGRFAGWNRKSVGDLVKKIRGN